jgi:hypothetical protein
MPPAVQAELAAAAGEEGSERLVKSIANLLIAAQQVYGGRTEGTVGESALLEAYAAYQVDSTMTTVGPPADDAGLELTVSLMPSRNSPFMVAQLLKRYVDQGFPESISHPEASAANAPVRFSGRIATVRELDLIGPSVKSPNQRFTLVWSDIEREDAAAKSSRWAVLDGTTVLSHGTATGRIGEGAISDAGRFLVSSTLSIGEHLRSSLIGIEWKGTAFFSAEFGALAGAVCISASGRLGAIHLLGAGHDSPDGNALVLFDLVQLREIWRRRLAIIPRQLAINEDAGLVDSTSRQGLRCSFHLDGRCALDEPTYVHEVAASKDPVELAVLAWMRLDDLERIGADEVGLKLLDTAVSRSSDPYFRARTLRDLGEVTLKAGLSQLTVDFWRRALQISPQIGVKKRLADLERQAGVAPAVLAKPAAKLDGRLEITASYEKVRADQIFWFADSLVLARWTKGQTAIEKLIDNLKQELVCQLPGANPRFVHLGSRAAILTDEGRIGEGKGWVSLIDLEHGLMSQVTFDDKLTDCALAGSIVVVGCRNGHLYGLDSGSLRERWRYKVPGPGDAYSVAHPYYVAARDSVAWLSYMSTVWAVDASNGRQLLQAALDVPTGLAPLPGGSVAAGIFKGVVFASVDGRVKLTPTGESNPRIYAVDDAARRLIAGRWGQGDTWYSLDFDGRLVNQATLGPCSGATTAPGRFAYWDGDRVSIITTEFETLGTMRQPDVTGNRVRTAVFEPDGSALWVVGKGVRRIAIR